MESYLFLLNIIATVYFCITAIKLDEDVYETEGIEKALAKAKDRKSNGAKNK